MATIDYLFDVILQLSLLAFVVMGISALIVRKLGQPLERIRLIQMTLPCLLLAAVLSQVNWTPSIRLPVLPIASDATVESAASFAQEIPQLTTIATTEFDEVPTNSFASAMPPGQTPSPSPANRSIRWTDLAKALVVIGLLAMSVGNLLYLLVGLALTRRLVRSAQQLSPTVQSRAEAFLAKYSDRDVAFAHSSRVSVPMVSGLFNPTILLPAELADQDADETQLKHGIAHEWKHIDRNGLVTWHLTTFAQVLLWIQPFYWMLRRELRLSQDQIADEFAADQTDDLANYAETLVGFTKSKQRVMLGALTMAGTKSNLYRRVELLLNEKFQVSSISRKRVLFACAGMLTAGGMLLASIELTQAAPPADAQVDESEEAEKQNNDKPNEQVAKTKTEGEAVSHSGKIIDAITGEPVEGATVVVTRMISGPYNVIGRSESVTDADGSYTFEIPPDQLKKKALYILFDLRHPTYVDRHCGSYSYSMLAKNMKLGSLPWFTELKMIPGVEVSGRLVNENGDPVAGAQLRMKTSDPSAGNRMSSSIDGISDDDGGFSFAVSRNGTAAISIIPRDYCMKHVEFGGKRGDVGDIKLTKGVSIRGRVIDAKGKPMEGLWVNLTEQDTRQAASYEMKRSSQTDASGEFTTRPLNSGKHMVEVQMKATGAIEKLEYANFHDVPTPAMFVSQIIDVAEDSVDNPITVQAVPHVFISGNCVDSKGEVRAIHSPYVMGKFNDQSVWIRKTMKVEKGSFKLMVPHGIEDANLRFMTNEHSALTIQFPGEEMSTIQDRRFERIEEDITGIKVVRTVAPILQVDAVDQDGNRIKDARISVRYEMKPPAPGKTGMMEMMSSSSYFEKQKNGLYQSSSLVPDVEFTIMASTDSLECEKKMSMVEGSTEKITLTLKPMAERAAE